MNGIEIHDVMKIQRISKKQEISGVSTIGRVGKWNIVFHVRIRYSPSEGQTTALGNGR